MLKTFAAVLLAGAAAGAGAGEITVSAAASLTNAFREMAGAYEAAHPGDKVQLNVASSDTLVQQIARGAPVDVLASADEEAMDKAAGQKLIAPGSRRDFASNSLVLIAPASSTLPVAALSDLGQPGVHRIAAGNPASVPAGRYTRDALQKAGLWTTLESRFVFATSVRQGLDYVARGEAEAGFVYATDAATQPGKVKVLLTVPTEKQVRYPLAVTAAAPNGEGARRFCAFVLSVQGQAILAKFGFGRP
ncbi:molybdate ABC transporter substrate-binding protein [Massilia endophytica]|uniref:molybdate ABC transporter substrate-binding protein n=1 Tax=Massilia endophytica TaxID=2899220 RepID=UPI001E56AE2B|nr:molybdate ABC transporter substrate-binding protein [Massilia endophytica]UGQ47887.1 molybdate ABC transporter substrate-binding protein [Massilia endophytica]